MRECKVLVKKASNTNLYRQYHTNQLLNGNSPRVSGVCYFYPGSATIEPSGVEDGEDYICIEYTEIQKKTNLTDNRKTRVPKSKQDDQPKLFKLAMKLLEIHEVTEISISNYMLGIQLANELFSWDTVEPKVLLALHEVLEMPLAVRTIHERRYFFEYENAFMQHIQVPYEEWFYFPHMDTTDLKFVKIEDNDTDDQDTISTNVLPRPLGFTSPAGA